ncbi:MAG: ABC transporter permease subunit [Blautia faecis]
MKWKLKGAASMFISIGLFIPLQVSPIPLSVLIKNMGLANTHWALILPYIAFNLAFPFMIISSSFRALPAELEEAAVIDGASIYKTFFNHASTGKTCNHFGELYLPHWEYGMSIFFQRL